MYVRQMPQSVRLEARKPGGEWGVCSRMNHENDCLLLPEGHSKHMTLKEAQSETLLKAQRWQETVRDDTQYRVVVY
jgi:hypothetical protein